MLQPPATLSSPDDLALAYQSQAKFTECQALARDTEAIERNMQSENWPRFWTESRLGASLAGDEEIRRSRTAVAGRLSRHAGKKGPDSSREPPLSEQRPRMDRADV